MDSDHSAAVGRNTMKSIEDEERELEIKIAAAADNLREIRAILSLDLDVKLPFNSEIEDDVRLQILVKHFEAHESFYLAIRKACLFEDDYFEDEDDCDDHYPMYRILINHEKNAILGYYSNSNAYQLVWFDPLEIHGNLTRTRPVIANFDTYPGQ
jgi:hypothetical protein